MTMSRKTVQFTLQQFGLAHALVPEYVTGCFQQSVHLRSFRQLSCAHGQCSVTADNCCQGAFCTSYKLQNNNKRDSSYYQTFVTC